MKNSFFKLAPRTACWLLTLTIGVAANPTVSAQPHSQPGTSAPAQLRVIVTPLPASSVLRVRYESADYGSVRLQLRDDQGRVLFTELLRRARFAGDFDLTAFPTGRYTLELLTPGTRYAQAVDLRRSSPSVALLAALPTAPAAR